MILKASGSFHIVWERLTENIYASKKPSKSGSSFFNYKHSCSVVLMAAVDSESKFTTIDVGSMGRCSDDVFSKSALGKKIESKSLNIP